MTVLWKKRIREKALLNRGKENHVVDIFEGRNGGGWVSV